MKNLLKILCIAFFAWVLVSCGTRKTQKSEIKESEKKELSLNTEETKNSEKVTETETKTETVIQKDNDIKEAEENLDPIDPSKPMTKTETVDGNTKKTTWENAKVNNKSKEDNSKSNESTVTNENKKEAEKLAEIRKAQLKQKEEAARTAKLKGTQSESGFPWWSLWFLLLIPAYIGYRKFKSFAT